MNKQKIKTLAISIAIPLLVGFTSAFITNNAMKSFSSLKQPPLSPPGIVFPIVWTILYILMGISFYFIIESDEIYKTNIKRNCIIIYIIQLIVNFFWSIFFFNLNWFVFSFLWLLLLWILILMLILLSKKLNNISYKLLIPYLLWATFALYLNIGVAILN